jgi:hypothetical protein
VATHFKFYVGIPFSSVLFFNVYGITSLEEGMVGEFSLEKGRYQIVVIEML